MMDPKEVENYVILAYADNVADKKEDGHYREVQKSDPGYSLEPEAIWFTDTNSLGVQFHPEMLASRKDSTAWKFFQDQLDKYIFL